MIDIGLKADALASNPTIVTAQKPRQSSNVAGMEEYSLYAEAGMVTQFAVARTFKSDIRCCHRARGRQISFGQVSGGADAGSTGGFPAI